uniref:Trafficking protein particle complex subunit 2-like protein n=1 Tax=Sus scrofa TaxID=9823 RepID=A0A8D1FBA0_PIG
MAVCVAVIAKENYPLYIRSVPTENELQFHYMLHTSLDVVDEKISAMGKALVDQRELYLGLLYPTEDYKVYGYVTNSKVKFVMVVDSSNTALRDNEIRSMFRKLHSSYTDVMCNPFYTPGDRIQSRSASQRRFSAKHPRRTPHLLPAVASIPRTVPKGPLLASS